ncbi:MAG: carboxypeptidase regulatory-like domain-containing protein [Anaerolineales bacterium]|nr:carboxypeptidase regulatory-like domain-containing protein [Anaerolineales bacterium]MBX3038024.1 carboxypeptidase regulatory-like domain-containing protein [Anaerolineales bacterium]
MKTKNFLRIVLMMMVLVSLLGASVSVQAKGLSAEIVIRSTTFWDATFNGNVNANLFERWSLQLTENSAFSVTVTTTGGDLTPTIRLLNSSGVEIAQAVGTLSTAFLSTSQTAGSYFIQIQPDTGGGSYSMEIRRTDNPSTDPHAAVMFNPAVIFIDETSQGSVMLNNVPLAGYASAEFTCSYDPSLISITNISQAGLFGNDPVVILNGPTNGSFLFAIAGSNGQRATQSGTVFTFTATGLAAGDASLNCVVRISAGGALTTIPFTTASLTVREPFGILEGTVIANKPVTVELIDSIGTTTTTTDANGNFSFTAPAGTYLVRATAPGFLPAEGDPVLFPGETTTMQTINLISGDIDGNGVIDQFDAMTIGMNYNGSNVPVADLNNDGIINILDLEILALNYRANGALNWPVLPSG